MQASGGATHPNRSTLTNPAGTTVDLPSCSTPTPAHGFMKKVDILYVGFVSGHGGDAMFMLELASGMKKRGKRVEVIIPTTPQADLFLDLCREHGLTASKDMRLMDGGNGALWRRIGFFLRHRAPVVHLHTGDHYLSRTTLLALDAIQYRRVFVTVQNPYDQCRSRYWVNAAPRRLHAVICPSDHGRQTQLGYGLPSTLIRTIHNGIDAKRFQSGHPATPFTLLGLPPESRLIVCSSRLDSQKRPMDALRVFSLLAGEFPEIHLAFLGEGGLRPELEKLTLESGLTERVHFLGFQDNIPDWLAAATVWYFPTERENFSLAVLEAMAAGCPILSTRCPGNNEIFIDGQNALITDVGDLQAQTDSLRRLLLDETLRIHLGEGARRSSAEHSMERVLDQHEDCYQLAVGGGPAK